MDTPKVVIVDDDDQQLRLFSQRFRYRGFEPILAQNEVEALQRLEETDSPIIIIDVGLQINTASNTDGIDLAVKIRQSYPSIVIILMTGDSQKALNVVRDTMSRGANGITLANNFYGKWESVDVLVSLTLDALNHQRNLAQQVTGAAPQPTSLLRSPNMVLYGIMALLLVIFVLTVFQVFGNNLVPRHSGN